MDASFNEIFSEKLRNMMRDHRLSQSDLARKLQVSPAAVSAWCNGTKVPRMDKIDAMCIIFECKRSDFMEAKNDIIVEYTGTITDSEKRLLEYYRLLTAEDKIRIEERMKIMLEK